MKSFYSVCWLVLTIMGGLEIMAQPFTTPDAPDLEVTYLDGIMTLSISNDNPLSNNFEEGFAVIDPLLDPEDNQWLFQGYLVYQIQLGFNELDFYDPEVARLVAQVDIEDDLSDLVNNQYDTDLGMCAPTLMVEGSNSGIEHMFEIDEDLWTGQPFMEGEIYCYTVLAYAAHPDGFNPDCGDLAYQFIRSQQSAVGALELQCKTAQNSVDVIEETAIQEMDVRYINGTIMIDSFPAKAEIVEVFDITGKLIYKGKISTAILVGSIPKGIYLLSVSDQQNNVLLTTRLIASSH